jgi:type I restriction-modification system DNA methylase subunit
MSTSLTIDTLRNRAAAFAKKFAHITAEKQHDQDFMREFYAIFGVTSQRIEWQYPVKTNKSTLWIDGLITGILLIEMKSAGKNLDEAYQQAAGYIGLIKASHQPDYVLVSDFANLHLYNRITGEPRIAIKLADLPQYIEPFLFLAGYEKLAIEKQERINKLAAEKMADLHDVIKATGYDGKDLESYLVRLLFCLFAEDTGLFGENGSFLDYLHHQTKADGSDLHGALSGLFDTLNKPDSDYLANHPQYNGQKRLKNLSEHLSKFPYINGALFQGSLSHCQFDEHSRAILMECAKLDWSEISPAIFGSLFQAIMHFDDEAANAKTKKRREFGAHYTSEENILKTINPLFMDDLRAEFAKCKTNKTKLAAFHAKLARLNFFDPACGCGNFLIIAYRELRLLELEVINAQFGDKQVAQLDVDTLILCNVHQFHGIDIDESAVQIATLALWLVDHQMNLRVKVLGAYYHRIPLVKKANIVCANALRLDWQSVIAPSECSFIMGNPPFIGKKEQSPLQKADIESLVLSNKGAGVLDYVTAWYIKATAYIKNNPTITAAFVSTNSICQGEQVCILWGYLSAQGVKIHFAHRTFQWSNEGRGVAAVHCVIIGFGLKEPSSYRLFDYGDNIKGEPIEIKAKQINPYLVDAPSVILIKRMNPLGNAPKMDFGSKAVDFGHLTLTEQDRDELLQHHPNAIAWIRPFIGSEEFINGTKRYCLWLKGITADELKSYLWIMRRIELVRQTRLKSVKASTRDFSDFPTLFQEDRQPETPYLLIPKVSSEKRKYVPLGFCEPNLIVNPTVLVVPDATLFHFGFLQSSMHMAWMRAVCGRMKSDYQYSNTIVYNNFPWATPDTKQIKTIEEKAQAILDARAEHKTSTLADLYNPLTMPPNLVKAHNALDKAVDAAYGYKGSKDDAARVAFLFELYQNLTAPLMDTEQVKKPRKSRRDRLA